LPGFHRAPLLRMTSAAGNKLLLRKLVVIAVAMFGFGFALVPIYKKICQAAGIYDIQKADVVSNTQVDTSRTLTIQFDANMRDLPWTFRPLQKSVQAHPGELVHVVYEVTNTTDIDRLGQAIPSY